MPTYRITVQRRTVSTLVHEIEVPEGRQYVTTDAETLELIDDAYAQGWPRTTKLTEPDAGFPHTDQDVVMDFMELPSRVGM